MKPDPAIRFLDHNTHHVPDGTAGSLANTLQMICSRTALQKYADSRCNVLKSRGMSGLNFAPSIILHD